MKNDTQFYLGMDVSKLWVDIAVLRVINGEKQPVVNGRFDNDAPGMKTLDKWLKKQGVAFNENSSLVIENTGVYHRLVWEYCSTEGLPLYIGNATHIKWSFGIARGKSDTIDSQRLCTYAFKNREELKATALFNPAILRLKDMMTARTRLVAQRKSIKVYLGEMRLSNSKETQTIIEEAHKAALEGISSSLKNIENGIKQMIEQDDRIKKNHALLLSVPGIGHLTAVYLICCTNNFICKISGKQLASYAGVAPFSNTSGSSIKGRDKVHKMANKDLKKLLHMGAISAMSNYPEFKDYYERKVKEGKHVLSVINAVRSKIALRAVAVINNQQMYVDKYKKVA